jgi:hypothetical protein
LAKVKVIKVIEVVKVIKVVEVIEVIKVEVKVKVTGASSARVCSTRVKHSACRGTRELLP